MLCFQNGLMDRAFSNVLCYRSLVCSNKISGHCCSLDHTMIEGLVTQNSANYHTAPVFERWLELHSGRGNTATVMMEE